MKLGTKVMSTQVRICYTHGAGFAFFVNDPASPISSSYLLFQDKDTLKLFKQDSLGNKIEQKSFPAPVNPQTPYTYAITFVPLSGTLTIFRNGIKLGMFTDPSPIQSGQGLLFLSKSAKILIDNLTMVAIGPKSTQTYNTHTDHLGSSSILTAGLSFDGQTTTQTGTITQQLDSFPYGEERLNLKSGLHDTPKKYTGKELDEETGLYYYGARYYDARLGRFVSEDPAAVRDFNAENLENINFSKILFNPQLLNAYSYVGNNPLKYIDPSGKDRINIAFGYAAGVLKGGWNAIKGTGYMIIHPIETGENVATIMAHPKLAAQAFQEYMGDKYDELINADDYRAGEMIGEFVGELATPVAMAKFAQRISKLAAIGRMLDRVNNILKPEGRFVGYAASNKGIRIMNGTTQDAENFFNKLTEGAKLIEDKTYAGKLMELPDGSRIGFRPTSTSGPPTIDINVEGIGIREIKFTH